MGVLVGVLCSKVRVGAPSLLVHRGASRRRERAIASTASLDVIAIDARSSGVVVVANGTLFLSLEVDVFEVECMDVTRDDAVL